MAVVIAMAAIGAFSTDLYLPSVPSMRLAFATTVERLQWTLSAYFLGAGIAQFLFGVLADGVGRRGPILIGLATYFLASLLILVAPNIEMIIALRFAQGFGAAVGGVLGVLVLRDLFEGEATARWMGHRASAVSLSFLFAPLLGGWLEISFGWVAPLR